MIKNKKLNIAIVGLGNIGLNLYEHLINNKKIIKEKTNINLEVKYVSAKSRFKKRRIKIPKKKWLKNCFKASKLKDIDIVNIYDSIVFLKRYNQYSYNESIKHCENFMRNIENFL